MQILTSFIVNILALKMHDPEKMNKKNPGCMHATGPHQRRFPYVVLGASFPTRFPFMDFSYVGKYDKTD